MGLATIIKKNKIKQKQMRILVLGLDNAGKSTAVARWLHASTQDISPTFGFKIHTLAHSSSYTLHIWDIGGQRSIRAFWRNYYEDVEGIVFVIDSAAPERLDDSLAELALLIDGKMESASVLILANKQDVSGVLSQSEISKAINDNGILNGVHWSLFGCSSVDESDERVVFGLDWLVSDISTRLYSAPRSSQKPSAALQELKEI